MRIAVSGAHRVGKTTLVETLGRSFPEYELFDEPYYVLEERGHHSSVFPSIQDFKLQFECSVRQLKDSDQNSIIDRCPLDIVAYLSTHPGSQPIAATGVQIFKRHYDC